MADNDNPNAIGDYVWIKADSSGNRRSRAAEIGAEKRAYQKEHGVTLEFITMNRDEAPGFLSRTAVRYRITR